MKKACILYKKEDAAKNGFLISRYCRALRSVGLSPSVVMCDRLSDGEVEAMARGSAAVINRTRDAGLAAFLESRGLFVSNPSFVTETANDKLITYLRLSAAVPMMETHLLPETGEPPLPYPFVAKPVGGHGGRGVSMITSREELDRYRRDFPVKSVVQPPASEPGRDTRVYVIGGRPVACMERTSKNDFRSNYSLGGSARFIPVDRLLPDEREIVAAVTAALPIDYAGVDIMRHEGRAVLNEIEDPVGARMLYTFTDIDPARLHIEALRL